MSKIKTSQPENFEAWLVDLETTDEKQGRGALCRVDGLGNLAFCCLGRGSVLAGVKGTLVPGNDILTFEGASCYLPHDAVAWLGLPAQPVGEGYTTEDVNLDMYLTERVTYDGHVDERGRYYSASQLNDAGCTFAQIAQLIRYFGTR